MVDRVNKWTGLTSRYAYTIYCANAIKPINPLTN